MTVVWIVDACAAGLERRPGSKMIGSNIPGPTRALGMLDNVMADMVVSGISVRNVDGIAED